MDFTAVVLCLFLLLCQSEGDRRKYVKTETDLLLYVGERVSLKEDDFLFWKFNSTVTIVRLTHTNEIKPNQIYTGRAELFPQNKSLLLKNVQKTDSGEYSAGVFGNTNRDLVKYQVTVLDPVSDVKLEVEWCGSDQSDLTVTCTTLDGRLSSTFICVKTTCSHEGGELVPDIPPGASMKVYLKNGHVTCHHSNQVSSAKDTKSIEDHCGEPEGDVREETLSVKTGTDLLLDVGEPVTINKLEFMFWKFKTQVKIVRLTHTNEIVLNPDYTGRAELFPQNQSLLLKNVQKTDSGEYRAGVSGFINNILVKYKVTVVDPVSDVKLEVKQCSSDRSNLTVTCTTLDGRLSSTFICDNTTCSLEGGEPTMKVYLKNDSVTCDHSNQVSSTEVTKTIEDLCRNDLVYLALMAVIVVAVILVVVCCCCCCRRRQQKDTETEMERLRLQQNRALTERPTSKCSPEPFLEMDQYYCKKSGDCSPELGTQSQDVKSQFQ